MRALRDTRTRAEKLRDMANHPTSNPHEAAAARAELGRMGLDAEAPPPRLSWLDVGRARDFTEFADLFARMQRQDAADDPHWGREWAASVAADRRRRAAGIQFPGEAGYYDWARTLKAGDELTVEYLFSWEGPKPPVDVTVARVTSTQYVMDNGDRYRRSGKFPGYRVGGFYGAASKDGRWYIRKPGTW